MAEPGSSGSGPAVSSNREMDSSIEAVNHLIQGKRHLLVQDYPSAVGSLQEACELFVKKYGETGNECGEVYFHYGKALLELAREECGVLGGPLEDREDKEDDDDDDDDKDSDEDQAETAESVSGSEQTEVEKVEGDSGDNDKENGTKLLDSRKMETLTGGESSMETDVANESKPSGEEAEEQDDEGEEEDSTKSEDAKVPEITDEAGPSGLQSEQTEKEEDISNLQLAWEVLELAKIIFKRQSKDNKEKSLRAAEVLLKLGEVSIESENYEQAVEDLQECLSIQKKYLQPDDRLLAETHYQLGLAYTLDNKFDDAIQNYKQAIDVIYQRIACLQKDNPVGVRPSSSLYEQDPKVLAKEEIKELEVIVKDITTKIDDTEDLMRNTHAEVMGAIVQRLGQDPSFEQSPSANFENQPTTDIGHLIKRKQDSPFSQSPSASIENKPTTDIDHLIKRKQDSSFGQSPSASIENKPTTDIGHLMKRKVAPASASPSSSSEIKPAADIGHLIKRESPSTSISPSSSTDNKPATDIGHLVKRKRKPDETGEFSADAQKIKKAKEDVENTSSGTVNGELQKQLESSSAVKLDCVQPHAGDSDVVESLQSSDEKSTAVS